jgi:hypothetical protein
MRRLPEPAQMLRSLAAGSFAMATAHGAGLMLVPALMPLSAGTTGASDAATAAVMAKLSAVGINVLTMLALTGVIASAISHIFIAPGTAALSSQETLPSQSGNLVCRNRRSTLFPPPR